MSSLRETPAGKPSRQRPSGPHSAGHSQRVIRANPDRSSRQTVVGVARHRCGLRSLDRGRRRRSSSFADGRAGVQSPAPPVLSPGSIFVRVESNRRLLHRLALRPPRTHTRNYPARRCPERRYPPAPTRAIAPQHVFVHCCDQCNSFKLPEANHQPKAESCPLRQAIAPGRCIRRA